MGKKKKQKTNKKTHKTMMNTLKHVYYYEAEKISKSFLE